MKKIIFTALFLFGSGSATQAQVGASIFGQGKAHVSINGGYGTYNDEDYFILGGGLGYYILNGLDLGVDGQAWLGSDPTLYQVSPKVTYTFYQSEKFKPYIGAFYRRTFYEGLKDLDSAGGRAGLATALNEHSYLRVGAVYQKHFDCNSAIYDKCSEILPEFSISFSY